MLQAAGVEVGVSYASFGLRLAKERWLQMVADRYMSLLAGFSEAELSAGIREIDDCFPGPVLEFEDRFAFILARAGQA